MAQKGLAHTTKLAQFQWLRKLHDAAGDPTNLAFVKPEANAVDFILRFMQRRARIRRWRWSTTRTAMTEVAGAFRNLGIYCPNTECQSWTLNNFPAWRLAMRKADITACAEVPNQPKEISKLDVLKACEKTDAKTAAIIAITWITAGRTGATLQLKKEDVDVQDNALTVTWRRGKTVRLRQEAHTVFAQMGRFKEHIMPYLRETKEQGFLFHAPSRQERGKMLSEVKLALRQATGDPEVENRSLRRGALMAMARAGAPNSALKHFSGHSTDATLRRYLAFGKDMSNDRNATSSFATALCD
jgi:integrase